MERNRRRLLTGLAAGGILAGALAGGGVAIASTGSGGPALAATTATSTGAPSMAGAPAAGRSGRSGNGHRGVLRHFARRHPLVVRSAFRSAAAYLGLTRAQLRAQLRDGKSLAQVAAAAGKPVPGLQNAILAGAVKAIDAHTGWTAARKAALTGRVESHLNAIVNATFPYGIGGHAAASTAPAAAT